MAAPNFAAQLADLQAQLVAHDNWYDSLGRPQHLKAEWKEKRKQLLQWRDQAKVQVDAEAKFQLDRERYDKQKAYEAYEAGQQQTQQQTQQQAQQQAAAAEAARVEAARLETEKQAKAKARSDDWDRMNNQGAYDTDGWQSIGTQAMPKGMPWWWDGMASAPPPPPNTTTTLSAGQRQPGVSETVPDAALQGATWGSGSPLQPGSANALAQALAPTGQNTAAQSNWRAPAAAPPPAAAVPSPPASNALSQALAPTGQNTAAQSNGGVPARQPTNLWGGPDRPARQPTNLWGQGRNPRPTQQPTNFWEQGSAGRSASTNLY